MVSTGEVGVLTRGPVGHPASMKWSFREQSSTHMRQQKCPPALPLQLARQQRLRPHLLRQTPWLRRLQLLR